MMKLNKKENRKLGYTMGNAKLMKENSQFSVKENEILNKIGRQIENKFDSHLEKFHAKTNPESYNQSNLSFKSHRNFPFP